jgi:hypothetical protein
MKFYVTFCIFFLSLFHTVMRLGKKKEKDRDGEKEQCIDGIARLICSAKQSHPAPLRGEFFFLIIASTEYCYALCYQKIQ